MEENSKFQLPSSKSRAFSGCWSLNFGIFLCDSVSPWLKVFCCFLSYLLVVIGFSLSCCAATNEGNQVVIVYNSRMPGSKEVAEHYAEKRMVPPSHIFGFNLT